MILRDYQESALSALYDWFRDGGGDPLVVAPTGSGKSAMIGAFCQRAIEDYPETRILVLTHVKELIAQNHAAFLRLCGGVKTSIYSAGLGKKNLSGSVVFAGVQSFVRVARQAGHFDLVLVDEAHLIPRKSGTTYRKTLGALAEVNPSIKMIGFTATPYRLDSGQLHKGKDAIFDGIAYEIEIGMLVDQGHLAPLISKRPINHFDTSGLHTARGDYIEKEMDERFNRDSINAAIVDETIELANIHDLQDGRKHGSRKHWLVFCISVEHARAMRDEIRSRGLSCEMVTGQTPSAERARILRDFKEGRIRALTNCNVLTTGFDAPATDLIVMARPTQSPGLYVQIAGRGMRIAEGKDNCLVLDFAGNVMRHGPVDAIIPPREKGDKDKNALPPAKECPECHEIVAAGCRRCPACDYEFPPPEMQVDETASTEAIMQKTAVEAWRPVQDILYERHKKPGKPDSMKVEYLVDGHVVREWVCFEHGGYARQKAVAWWVNRTTRKTAATVAEYEHGSTPPDTVDEALMRRIELKRPTYAVIRREGKFWNLSKIRYDQPRGEDYAQARADYSALGIKRDTP